MKKTFIYILSVIFIIIIIIAVIISNNIRKINNINEYNKEYEIYEDKEVFGTNVTTIINKAINNNIKNEVAKDEKGFFIQDDNSIKVEVIMLNEGKKTTYQMETIEKTGITGFVKNFNLIKFKCSKIEYNDKTKKISKIIFEQLEE